MTGFEKRLARALAKLLRNPHVLSADGAGGYRSHSTKSIRLSAKMSQYALGRGLLVANQSGGVRITDSAGQWLQRTTVSNQTGMVRENPFSAQHWKLEEREIFDPAGDLITVQVNIADSPLLWLYRQRDEHGKRFLSSIEFAAGEKLRQDYACSAMGRMSASNWTRVRQGKSAARSAAGAEDANASILDAKQRVMSALASAGPVLDRVLFRTLICQQGLTPMEQEQKWPRRSAKVVLKIALARLARHYGLVV